MAARSKSSSRSSSRGSSSARRSSRSSASRRSSSRRSAPAARSKPASRRRGRRYGQRASSEVGQAMHEMKRGELRSGRSRRRVTRPEQAIAIGLSKARRAGAKVPPAPAGRGSR